MTAYKARMRVNVDPVVKSCAAEAARIAGMSLSEWVERAMMRQAAQESIDRACLYAARRDDSAPTRDAGEP